MNTSDFPENFVDSAEISQQRQVAEAIRRLIKATDASATTEIIFVFLHYSDGENERARVSGQEGDITPNSPIGQVALSLPVGKSQTIELPDGLEVTITVTKKGGE